MDGKAYDADLFQKSTPETIIQAFFVTFSCKVKTEYLSLLLCD